MSMKHHKLTARQIFERLNTVSMPRSLAGASTSCISLILLTGESPEIFRPYIWKKIILALAQPSESLELSVKAIL